MEALVFAEHVMRVSCPGTHAHFDFCEGRGYPNCGAIVTFCFVSDEMHRRARLENFNETLMLAARSARICLTIGVSFAHTVLCIAAQQQEHRNA